ncbi:MAG: PQQ-binding-like beta-propeller repeat protein [Chloroflexi bacterium]|nr:PQQ-binding-like beta-propeller repeat protein [Chloroflexota bacterium]
MSDAASHGTGPESTVTCRWCGAENQILGESCQRCDRFTVRRPRWADIIPSNQKWLTKRRVLRIAIALILLVALVWFNYPFVPNPMILLFKKPTTNLASSTLPGQWSTAGRDQQSSRYLPQVPDEPRGQVSWSRFLGINTQSTPTVADGVVYLGAHFKVLALDAETGTVIWEQATKGPVHSSPAVAGDTLFLGFMDHRMLALEQNTGTVRWQFETGGAITGSANVTNGIVYFGSWDNFIYALDAATGELIWKTRTVGEIRSAVAVHEGALFASDNEGNLYILNARTGQKRMRFRTGKPNAASPAVGNGLAYFPSGGKVYGIDAGVREIPGELQFKKIWAQFWLWQVPGIPKPSGQRGARWRFSPKDTKASIISSPAVTAEAWYAGDTQGLFYARDAIDGTELWSFQADVTILGSPVVLGNRVYFGDMGGEFYSLDRNTGQVIWQVSLGAPIAVSPVFAQGRFFVRTTDGRLHAIE